MFCRHLEGFEVVALGRVRAPGIQWQIAAKACRFFQPDFELLAFRDREELFGAREHGVDQVTRYVVVDDVYESGVLRGIDDLPRNTSFCVGVAVGQG